MYLQLSLLTSSHCIVYAYVFSCSDVAGSGSFGVDCDMRGMCSDYMSTIPHGAFQPSSSLGATAIGNARI